MANKSKNKGKSFERELCAFLTQLFGLNFQRVPNSGAFVGGFNAHRYEKLTDAQRLLADGDIIVPEELQNFSIECKSYKDFPFHGLIDTDVPILDKWIAQASHTNKKYWLLVFKISNKGWYAVYDPKSFEVAQAGRNVCVYKNVHVTEAKSFITNNKEIFLKVGGKNE